jgi:hypothetical protein
MTSKNDTSYAIARQSQSKLLLEWANSCGYCITLPELIGITEILSDYVVNGYTKEIKEKLTKVQDHVENKKKG